jgi:glycosyltransferase involved in cell wall biosynthesis
MYRDKKVIVVFPAYNAQQTIRRTYEEVIAQDYVDLVIVVDDASSDETAKQVAGLPNLQLHVHEVNCGYGANQKTCYRLALEAGGDIIIMVHPDYQYTPKLIPAMASLLGNGLYDCALGSRILGGHARRGGMPWWRYIANRALTFAENVLLRAKLSEYHTGYRAFTREVLMTLPLDANSDDFVFDNQMLAQLIWYDFAIGEISCPTRYATDASSISFWRSVRYGFGCLWTAAEYVLSYWRIAGFARFPQNAARDRSQSVILPRAQGRR